MVTVVMTALQVSPGDGTASVTIDVATTTQRHFGVDVNVNLTDTIPLINSNIRAAAIAYLQDAYPDDTNWNLAVYILFGPGQII